MRELTEIDKENICKEYLNGQSIKILYEKYKVGDRRIRAILTDHNIEIYNSHKKTVSDDDYIEKNVARFPIKNGYHYIAKSKDGIVEYDDYLNKSGILTAYIKKNLKIKIPSLYLRKKYFHENNKQWYEQFFNIVELKDEEKEYKICPYCGWKTSDIKNNSGMFETHLLKEHSITKLEYIETHPEERSFFTLVNKTKDRKMETDPNKYVVCAICGEKFARLDWRHLSTHHLTKQQYVNIFFNKTVSSELHNKLRDTAIEVNKTLKPTFISKAEYEISDFIRSCGVECENCNREILNGKEIDIYIPSKKIGIEYNGNFWHTTKYVDKNKHLQKTEECEKQGVKLIQIFEDEFILHKEIVFNKIKHIINVDNALPKIMGRKCKIKEINKNEAENFLNRFHIQGFISSTVYLGAFHEEKLVAVMTFKMEGKDRLKWELNRFASDYNYVCCGVGGKLFNYFIKKYCPSEVKSFADRRWTVDKENNIYIKLGFKFEKYIYPDYKYYNKNIEKYTRFHKFGFRKQILHKKYGFPLTMTESEMTKALGYEKIYDCGLIRYVWKTK